MFREQSAFLGCSSSLGRSKQGRTNGDATLFHRFLSSLHRVLKGVGFRVSG